MKYSRSYSSVCAREAAVVFAVLASWHFAAALDFPVSKASVSQPEQGVPQVVERTDRVRHLTQASAIRRRCGSSPSEEVGCRRLVERAPLRPLFGWALLPWLSLYVAAGRPFERMLHAGEDESESNDVEAAIF